MKPANIVMSKLFKGTKIILLPLLFLIQASGMVLYLTDGTRLDVSEYEIKEDRVRYFSVARGQWEEVPRDLIDFKRSQQYNSQKKEQVRGLEEQTRKEQVAERRARTELHTVPLEDGVYYMNGQEQQLVEQGTVIIGKNKKRTVLNVLAPMPVLPGKQTLALVNSSARLVTADSKPIFYLRLHHFSRFGIARLKLDKKRNRRIVQSVFAVPHTDQKFEKLEEMDVFRQQLAPLVYKIWPTVALPAGEYGVFEYTPGEMNLRVWDFSHQPLSGPAGS